MGIPGQLRILGHGLPESPVTVSQNTHFMIRAYQAIRPGIENILLWNRSTDKAHALARTVEGNARVTVTTDLAQAVAQADIVCCATTSYAPLIQGKWLTAGTHVDLIGGYTPDMREADDETIRRASVFVDSRRFTIEHVGDLTQPIRNGVITASDVVGDLFDLASGRCAWRQSADEITLFKSGGGAHLDLMSAQYIASAIGN
jgi:ornithine cyclodeaminase